MIHADRPRGSAGWLLAWSAAFLVGSLLLGASLHGSFGDTLRLLLLGLALLYAAAAVYLWWRHLQPGAAPHGAPSRWTRRWQTLLVGAIVTFPVAVVLHNAVSGLTGIEEPVFFLIAVIGAPVAFIAGAVGTLVTVLWTEIGLGRRQSDPS
jgi:hypothetical protein